MKVVAQKYGAPHMRETFDYDDGDESVAVADHYIAKFFPADNESVTLVEVVDGPPKAVGVWRVEDLGTILGRRATIARLARPDEIEAVRSGDPAAIHKALAATDEDRRLRTYIEAGASVLESFLSPRRMVERMYELGKKYRFGLDRDTEKNTTKKDDPK